MRNDILKFYKNLSAYEIDLLEKHLIKRFTYDEKKDRFNIVFDILHECNLCCLGCGTNSLCSSKASERVHCSNSISLENIECVLMKCKDFADSKHKKVFINFGGGEPFLRDDILDVLKLASGYFGSESIGIDTNGTLDGVYELIASAMPYLSYVGISINGLREYHNWWTNITSFDAFERSINTVERICQNPDWSSKLEVTSVATKKSTGFCFANGCIDI